MEHWKWRHEAYHQAVEDKHFAIVDLRPANRVEAKRSEMINKAHTQLNLGVHNRDYIDLVMNGKPAEGGEYEDYSAILYVRRQDAPRVFETLDEIFRLVEHGKTLIRDRLGMPQ